MKRLKQLKTILFYLLVLLILAAVLLSIFTPQGQAIRHNPHAFHQDVETWVMRHPVSAPLAFIGLYILMSILAVPVWWLQILAGYGFGLVPGIVWSSCAAGIAAPLTVKFSHFLAGDYFHEHFEVRMTRLHRMMDKLGHNGLLVVMAVRLMHVIPFGLSNYLFGLTAIRPLEAALGTIIGGLPAIAFYVAASSTMRTRWEFWLSLIGVNLILLTPFLIHRILRKNKASEMPIIAHDSKSKTTTAKSR